MGEEDQEERASSLGGLVAERNELVRSLPDDLRTYIEAGCSISRSKASGAWNLQTRKIVPNTKTVPKEWAHVVERIKKLGEEIAVARKLMVAREEANKVNAEVRETRRTPLSLHLTLLGFVILLICLIPVTSAEEVINTSFTVSPGTKYGPYDVGTTYHTRVLGKSVLKGEVFVEGEGIYLVVNGYITKPLKEPYVKDQYIFTIDPANDLYTFTFDNSKGKTESLVRFTLDEIWTRPVAFGSTPFFVGGLTGLFLFLTGLIFLGISRLRSQRERSRRFETQQRLGS